MSSKAASTDGSKGGGIPDFFARLDPLSSPLDYIKRFFYQILGIYFPPVILILYFVLFWENQPHLFSIVFKDSIVSPADNLRSLFEFIKARDPIIQLILFIIAVAAIGEAINSITSKLAKISPIKRRNYLEKLRRRLGILPLPRTFAFSDPTKVADWPIWINVTRFPVTFAHFDRYYVSVLEQDKKTLAGKIGWLSFYRNMTAVFFIVSVLQSYLFILLYINDIDIFQKYMYEFYALLIAPALVVLFWFGHHAQANAHRTTLWDAYRRNELRKNLEIRYGELSLSLGIINKYKKKTIEYIVDRWFLGVEQSMQSLSSFLLTMIEELYLYTEHEPFRQNKESSLDYFSSSFISNGIRTIAFRNYMKQIPDKDKQASWKLKKIEPKIKELITDSYKEWNIGGYAQVISNALKALEISHISLTQTAWQTIHGQYNLENSLRTDAAFKEVEDNVKKWGWTYENQDKNSRDKDKTQDEHSSKSSSRLASNHFKKEDFDEAANIISKSANPYRQSFDKIMYMLKELRYIRTGVLHDFENFIVNVNGNKSGLQVNVDGRISEVKVDHDDKVFKLENNATKLKVTLDHMDLNKNIDGKVVLEININNRLSSIYRAFGANEYDNACKETQDLLGDIKIAQKLLERIYEDVKTQNAQDPKVDNSSWFWP
jgi:hypothetical protein